MAKVIRPVRIAVRRRNGRKPKSGATNQRIRLAVGKMPSQVASVMRQRGGLTLAGTISGENHASSPVMTR